MPAEDRALRGALPGALRGLLLDMDGTLVESESLWYASELAVMAQLGAPWGPEHQHKMLGGSLERTGAYMADLAGGGLSGAEVARLLVDDMHTRLQGELPTLPGMRELLAEASAAGVPCALVSSSPRLLMDAVLTGTGLRAAFAASVAGDEISRLKPHPEGYLTAASRLGVDPRACAVIEDSETGARAGEAAGCLVVGVASVVPLPPAPGRYLVDSAAELDLATLDALVAAHQG